MSFVTLGTSSSQELEVLSNLPILQVRAMSLQVYHCMLVNVLKDHFVDILYHVYVKRYLALISVCMSYVSACGIKPHVNHVMYAKVV